MIELRPYQIQLLDDIDAAFQQQRRVLAVAPTGSGKTVIFSESIRRTVAQRGRALILAHRREIVHQTGNKLRDARVVFSYAMAGETFRPTVDVQVGSVQTIAARELRPPADLVVVDEAHHVPAASWRNILEAYPNARILGLTATPCRADGRGLGDDFDALVEGPNVAELIRDGYLVGTKVYAPPPPDLSGVATARGDYVTSQLADKMDKPQLVGDIIVEWARRAERRPTIAFASSVGHSLHIAEEFQKHGVRAAHIDGTTPKAERDAALAQLAAGEITVLSNCNVLTEGFDLPAIACCILARPTKSMGLYRQMVGRILRPAPGKLDAIVLDHAGATHRHGFVEDPVFWTLDPDRRPENEVHDNRDREAGSRLVDCSNCGALRVGGQACGACGHMPVRPPKPFTPAEGELIQLTRDGVVPPTDWTETDRQTFYGELLTIADWHGYRPGWVAYKYKERLGSWPPKHFAPYQMPPSLETRRWVKSRQIAYAKSRERATA